MDKQPEHIMPLQLRGTKRPHPEEEGEVLHLLISLAVILWPLLSRCVSILY
uniref:Uncharacterized protein n=1 Tax=Anguilla anguilla TaxID=7936 RepID=A0A0E9PXH7_ANGAN